MARIIQTADLSPHTQMSFNEREFVYNGLDCCVTLEVFNVISEMLDEKTTKTYEFSLALQAPIMEMAMRGVLVDNGQRARVLAATRDDISRLAAQLGKIIGEGVGVDVQWTSPKQLNQLFYDVMNLPLQRKRGANGQMVPTSDRGALEKLSSYFIAEPICSHLLALRDLDKKRQFLETGIDADGRMRTNFNIAGTNTGRLASAMSDFGTGTNLQNVDRDLRSIFVSDPGWKFGNIDLEQGDSRNLGALCWERFVETYGEAFAGGYLDLCESGDLHTSVSRMARPTLAWTDDPLANRALADTKYYRGDSYRDLDKKLGHGSNYLGQPATMAKHSKVPVREVAEFQRNYFGRLPCIPTYHQFVRDEIKRSASLTTLFGRRRFFFGRPQDEATIREAVAYCPQSMTAEEINLGMLRLWRDGRVQLLVQVHDSILFQYREEREAEVIPWAIDALRVPLVLARGREFVVPGEAQVGWNWGKCADGNPDGLVKWKGGDERKRQRRDFRLNIRDW